MTTTPPPDTKEAKSPHEHDYVTACFDCGHIKTGAVYTQTDMDAALRTERERCALIAEKRAAKGQTIGDTKAIARAIRKDDDKG